MGCKRLTKWWYLQVHGRGAQEDECCKRLTKWWYLQGSDRRHRRRSRCKRLTKWWYLQGLPVVNCPKCAVKGLQNGGIYKTPVGDALAASAVKGLKCGGIYKLIFHSLLIGLAV